MKTSMIARSQTKSAFSIGLHSKNHTLLIFAAFWHTLRRDITVTFREFIPFLMQVLVSPFAMLLVFGRALPGMGTISRVYPSEFLPGIVALTIFLASMVGMSVSLMLDLDYAREIDDRLLAPMPVSLIAIEKVVFSTFRSLVAGALIFPLARWVLGSGYQVRTDTLVPLIVMMVLSSLTTSALGLVIGAALPADKLYMIFSLVFTVILYTGCVFYTWTSIGALKVFQIITLGNPVTYVAEGLRSVMVPPTNGQAPSTLPIGWAWLGLSAFFLCFLIIGIRTFRKRVIS